MIGKIGDTLLFVVPKCNLQQAIDEFIVSRRAGNCSKRTIEYYRDELRWFETEYEPQD